MPICRSRSRPRTTISLSRQPPSLEEQRTFLGRTFDYLQNAIPKLPDFYALRSTVRFEEPPEAPTKAGRCRAEIRLSALPPGSTLQSSIETGTRWWRKKKKLGKGRVVYRVRERGLETRGTFGPILSYVLTAASASSSTIRWERWERGKYGDLAVSPTNLPARIAGPNSPIAASLRVTEPLPTKTRRTPTANSRSVPTPEPSCGS